MGKNKSKRKNVVYSTNPDYQFEYDQEDQETLPVNQQKLYVSIDRKMRKGKSVTLIEGFVGSADDLKELAKSIKTACGVGGTSKNGEIMIQGEFKDKVVDLLFKLGYNSVKKGGY
ncbi:MAG: translation initiation factor [Flavobacteriales bacterium]|nr:translation initiation factor [Flavobacteriales bacterium]